MKGFTEQPVCLITIVTKLRLKVGLTIEKGPYTQWTYQESGATLESCLAACLESDECKHISYAERYTACYFFDVPVNGSQLGLDPTSYFAHYDESCDVEDPCDDMEPGLNITYTSAPPSDDGKSVSVEGY